MTSYDIVIVTDPRMVGGGNKSLAQEVRAHAAAGYTTGIMPFAAPTRGARPVDVSIRQLLDDGLVEWVRPDDDVHAGLLLARGPSIFLEPQDATVRLKADRAVLVANAVHPDPSMSALAYDPEQVDAALADHFGMRWEWSPLSEVVRQELGELTGELKMTEQTWGNIIELDRWRRARPRGLHRPFRLGRHSRDAVAKWPSDPEDILAAYPDDRSYDVRIMGGARSARDVLGSVPETWTVQAFGSQDPRNFLAGLDVYPYFHHPKLVEAFGRASLEAMASGAVVILPPYLELVFGPGALYGTPHGVQDVVQRLAGDESFLRERREAGWTTVTERFSPGAHVNRIRALVGAPRAAPSVTASPAPTRAPARPPRRQRTPRVVFFTDNGHGLGHISRMMAIASHCGDDIQPLILTMSEAFQLASESGIPVEYFPSIKRLGIDRDGWEQLLHRRLGSLLDRARARLLVVDHVNPAPPIFELVDQRPELQSMWVRRGLWRAGRRPPGAKSSHRFDHILEPLDLAAAMDRGATTGMTAEEVHYVRPINLIDREQLVSRDVAREALGLPLGGTAVLVNMSADDTAGLVQLITRVRDEVRRRRTDVTLFAPLHVLHADRLPTIDGVVMKPVYPVARYMNAFDAAISTTGYNTFHEIVLAGTPSIFMARLTGRLDDQALRARSASLGGFGLHVEDIYTADFERALDDLLDPVQQQRMRAAAAVAHPGNGAGDAAKVIADIVGETA